eukprot:Amastigsp_a341236_12.p3 type:complete len:143 gc:universal Amastigsp_a341236_12:2189-2617(+)
MSDRIERAPGDFCCSCCCSLDRNCGCGPVLAFKGLHQRERVRLRCRFAHSAVSAFDCSRHHRVPNCRRALGRKLCLAVRRKARAWRFLCRVARCQSLCVRVLAPELWRQVRGRASYSACVCTACVRAAARAPYRAQHLQRPR